MSRFFQTGDGGLTSLGRPLQQSAPQSSLVEVLDNDSFLAKNTPLLGCCATIAIVIGVLVIFVTNFPTEERLRDDDCDDGVYTADDPHPNSCSQTSHTHTKAQFDLIGLSVGMGIIACGTMLACLLCRRKQLLDLVEGSTLPTVASRASFDESERKDPGWVPPQAVV